MQRHSEDGAFVFDDPSRPYSDDECRHTRRFERRGFLTCQDCGAIYNEDAGEWVASHE